MSLFKIESYKCEWCGALFENTKNYHEIECKYDPKARTCVSCAYATELKRQWNESERGEAKATGAYCPRADEIFVYPHKKYCADYKKIPELISLNKDAESEGVSE